MKRRNFVLLASAGATVAAIPAIHFLFYRTPDYDKALAVPELLSLIWDQKNIADIGERYCSKFPNEMSERFLARILFSDVKNRDKTTLQEITKNDFQSNNTVIIDGWMLSRTEARQCALVYLLNKNG
ncbi:MAG: hypothetical protein JSU09_00420 [Bacteroidetes bacterium]|nr:hypothetical protein [Bacteroidota bacterium]